MSDDQEYTVSTIRRVGDFIIAHERVYGPSTPMPPWTTKPNPKFAEAFRKCLERHRGIYKSWTR